MRVIESEYEGQADFIQAEVVQESVSFHPRQPSNRSRRVISLFLLIVLLARSSMNDPSSHSLCLPKKRQDYQTHKQGRLLSNL